MKYNFRILIKLLEAALGIQRDRRTSRPRPLHVEQLEDRTTPSVSPLSAGAAQPPSAVFTYDAPTQTLTITGSAAQNSFNYAQASTQDVAGLHTNYTFTMNGITQSYTDAQLAKVIVNAPAQGAFATADLLTND